MVDVDSSSDNPLVDQNSDLRNNYLQDANPLENLDAPDPESGSTGFMTGITAFEAGWTIAQGVDQNDLGLIISGVAAAALDVVSAAVDPIAYVAGQLAESLIVSGRSRWTVVDPVRALLRLRLHVEEPAAFDVEVLVPARRLVGLLPAVAQGVPIGLTTNRRLHALGSTVDIRTVLRHVVVVRCPAEPGLAELADELLWSMARDAGGGEC